jgi:hypothetical protein
VRLAPDCAIGAALRADPSASSGLHKHGQLLTRSCKSAYS